MNTGERCADCGCAKALSVKNVTLEEQVVIPKDCKTVEKVSKVVANIEEDDSLTIVVKKQEAALKRLEEKHGSGILKENNSDQSSNLIRIWQASSGLQIRSPSKEVQ